MSCQQAGALTVCQPNERVELSRESIGEHWCFKCRERREFFRVVTGDAEPGYYEPNPAIICGTCNTDDGDCFPGTYREWE